jgi:hypothetical protein
VIKRALVRRIKRAQPVEDPIPPAASEPVTEKPVTAQPVPSQKELPLWVYLVGGTRIQVDEVTEKADGVWFKRGGVSTFLGKDRVERIEREQPPKPAVASSAANAPLVNWRISESGRIERFFIAKFGRQLPVTAFGQSDFHTSWGYDHRQGMDVGLHPDSAEGRGLIEFLRSEGIPFLAFRGAIPGVATGPHIHIGRASNKISAR